MDSAIDTIHIPSPELPLRSTPGIGVLVDLMEVSVKYLAYFTLNSAGLRMQLVPLSREEVELALSVGFLVIP